MSITNEDRYAVLERKLMEAESALFGCRAILHHIRRLETGNEGLDRVEKDDSVPGNSGLYPGQIRPPELQEEHLEEECVE